MTGCSVQEKHIHVSLNVQYVCISICIFTHLNTSKYFIDNHICLYLVSWQQPWELQVEEAASQKQVEEHLAHCRFVPDIFSITETAPGVCLDLSI